MPTRGWDRKHLLGLEGLSSSDLNQLMEAAERFLPVARGEKPRLVILAQRTIANLFFEDSTRTRSSFTLAARRLGADTLELTLAGSSVNKGETIVDTALNLQAMGVSAFVVRSGASGGPHMIAKALKPGVPVINAGDGRHEHPTQGLLDLLTLRQRLGDLKGKTIGIVGDVLNSRVARSNVHALTTMGANVLLIGPPTLVPKTFEQITPESAPGKVRVSHDLDDCLPGVNAIIMLRVQFERSESKGPGMQQAAPSGAWGGGSLIAPDYRQLYGLTEARAAKLPPHAVIMHPGPINRGLEIDSEVADDPKRSAILQQVTNGVAVRMAVLAQLLASD